MKKLPILILSTIFFGSCSPATDEAHVSAEDTINFDYDKTIYAHGSISKGLAGISDPQVVEFRDSEGCNYIILKYGDAIQLKEKSNSRCVQERE